MSEKREPWTLGSPHAPAIRSLFYVGMSMYPTLRNLDILSISSYENNLDIRRGDIIVFRSSVSARMIAHRVVGINIDGVRTRGDNMEVDDLSLKLYDQIIGKVEYVDRELKSLPISTGFSGLMIHYILRLSRILYFIRILKSWANRIICAILKSQVIGPLLTKDNEFRSYLFTSPEGDVIKSFRAELPVRNTMNNLSSLKAAPFSHSIEVVEAFQTNNKSSESESGSETNQIKRA